MKINEQKSIIGFSRLSKRGKLKWMVENFFKDPEMVMKELMSYWLIDEEKQEILDRFSENTISNFYLPYGVAPNFLLNGETLCVPMVIEESSVVAAASYAAKFWSRRGGFHAKVISTEKVGQIHFTWSGNTEDLQNCLSRIVKEMRSDARDILANMESRGGGLSGVELKKPSAEEPDLHQLHFIFDTVDSMGANFINSALERFSKTLHQFVRHDPKLIQQGKLDILMAILSNYTPNCLVRTWLECPIDKLGMFEKYDSATFADRFAKAIYIAKVDPFRAATHNKGIFNGIDAVVIATGNDFRAVEACGHVYASRSGRYQSLSDCEISNGMFRFWLEIPMALGTVGGLTALHPMAKRSLELLGHPNAEKLMMIAAAMGLAQNFAAIRSLVTTGIQEGHMRMHLVNMLSHLEATEREAKECLKHFKDKVVSFAAVRDFLDLHRSHSPQPETSSSLTSKRMG